MSSPFIGQDAGAGAISVSTSAASFTLPNGCSAIEIFNDGDETVFFRIGVNVTATTSDTANSTIGAGVVFVRGVPDNGAGQSLVRISAIGAAGGGKLRIVPGGGL